MDAQIAILVSAVAHAALLVVGWRAIPSLDETAVETDSLIADSLVIIRSGTAVPADPEDEASTSPPVDGEAGDRERSESRCGREHGGSMGEPSAAPAGRRYGVQGPSDNPDPHLAREASPFEPVEISFPFPWARASASLWSSDRAAPMVPWGRDDSLGNDPESARGNMWGDAFGTSFGSPGAGIGLRKLCPTCGDEGLGMLRPRLPSGSIEGGAAGTERGGASPP